MQHIRKHLVLTVMLRAGSPVAMQTKQEEKKAIEDGIMWRGINIVHICHQLHDQHMQRQQSAA